MPDPVMPTPAMDGDAPRWVEAPHDDMTDFVSADGRLLGYVSGVVRGWHGYITRPPDGTFRTGAKSYPDEPSARAWVEERVRMQGEGRTRIENEGGNS